MAERTVDANGISIWTEDVGDPADPPLLLVMGAGAQGIYWPDEFCQALADGGRYVIRYDNRDTGMSTCFDFAQTPYTLSDMARDAVGVLDAYGIDRAHIVGASMGGMITQQVAIEFPERVRTMTSIMSSPLGESITALIAGGDGELPGPRLAILEAVAAQAAGPPATPEERIERGITLWRALTGTLDPFDEERQRRLEERALDRASNPDAAQNHGLAIGSSPDRTDTLGQVTLPALVIHGTEDPILPYEHGVATAKAIPDAKLVTIEGMGHELPPSAVAPVVNAILEHTA